MWLILSGTALAQYNSTPQDMLYTDLLSPFNGVGVDTGYLPDPNGTISVRFHITPSGGVFTEMEAISDLRWPTAFHHSTQAVPGEGEFGIDVNVDVEFEVKIDLAGVYQDVIPVWTENLNISDILDFDTLVMPDSPEYPLMAVAEANLLDPFEYDIGIITGVGLEFAVDIEPQVSAELAGVAVETHLSGSIAQQISEIGTAQLDTPSGNPGAVLLTSTYIANLTSQVTLNIVPSATLDTFIGDFELVQFAYPVHLLDYEEERRFDPVAVTHPLPAMEPFEVDGFGEVLVDTLDVRNIGLVNLGLLGLEGTARIEGSDVFSVFPDYFYASDSQSDGVVVSFAPTAVGAFGATLVIESNDPVTPELRIPLDGVGIEPEPPTPPPTPLPTPPPTDDEPRPSVNGEDARGCGCDTPRRWMIGLRRR